MTAIQNAKEANEDLKELADLDAGQLGELIKAQGEEFTDDVLAVMMTVAVKAEEDKFNFEETLKAMATD